MHALWTSFKRMEGIGLKTAWILYISIVDQKVELESFLDHTPDYILNFRWGGVSGYGSATTFLQKQSVLYIVSPFPVCTILCHDDCNRLESIA
jgi:hypothetical protein